MTDRLIVAALSAELEAFQTAPFQRPAGIRFLVTGAGKTAAAAMLSAEIVSNRPDEVIVVGTAASVSSAQGARGEVYAIGSAVQWDVADESGSIGSHVFMPTVVQSVPSYGGRIGPGVRIASGDSFMLNAEARRDWFTAYGVSLVDMESYAYLWVCQLHNVPVRIFKAVTDYADGGAAGDWDTYVPGASSLLHRRLTTLGVL